MDVVQNPIGHAPVVVEAAEPRAAPASVEVGCPARKQRRVPEAGPGPLKAQFAVLYQMLSRCRLTEITVAVQETGPRGDEGSSSFKRGGTWL